MRRVPRLAAASLLALAAGIAWLEGSGTPVPAPGEPPPAAPGCAWACSPSAACSTAPAPPPPPAAAEPYVPRLAVARPRLERPAGDAPEPGFGAEAAAGAAPPAEAPLGILPPAVEVALVAVDEDGRPVEGAFVAWPGGGWG